MIEPTPTSTPPCLPCALARAAWQALRLLLLPRVLAFGGALVVLALMAPSGIPTPKRPPAKPAAAEAQVAPGAASAAASSPALSGPAGQVLTTTTTVTTTVTTTGPVAGSTPGAASASAQGAPSSPASSAAASAGTSAGPGTAPGPANAGTARVAGTSGTSATLGPDRGGVAASGVNGAPAQGRSAAPAASEAVMQPLRFRGVATLPSARVGVRWGPHVVLEHGRPPYTLRFVGAKPDWIEDAVGGALAGTPSKPETAVFTLEGSSKDEPGRVVMQTYRVQVLAAAKPPLPAGPPRLTAVGPEEARTEPPERDVAVTWRLDKDDLVALKEKLLPQPADADGLKAEMRALIEALRSMIGDGEATRSDPKAGAAEMKLPTAKQLGDMLDPLQEVDYPTQAHFRNAIDEAHCGYFKVQLKLIARARGEQPPTDETCPERPPPGARTGATAASMPPAVYFDALLPARYVDAIVAKARKPHPVDERFTAPWAATEGCGCAARGGEDEVHVFIPHWGTTEQQLAAPAATAASAPRGPAQAASAPRQTDFSLFTRASFFGAVLNDLGDAELPPPVQDAGHRLSSVAQRHGTRVDLVVYRNEWESLLRRQSREPERDIVRLAQRAADSTMKHVDARQKEGRLYRWADALLLPFWRDEVHAFAGVTVFFDNLPQPDNGPLAASFKVFHKAFVEALLDRMQKSGRAYGLNIVVPDDRASERGLFEFKDMLELVLRAEQKPRNQRLHKEDLGYRGTTDIRVTHIVMLSDPTTRTKKKLRELVDKSGDVTGAKRVVVLDSMVPMLLRPMAVKSQWALDDPAQQFRDDLAYLSWTFGGAALWEPPGQAKGDTARLAMLGDQFRGEHADLRGLCDWVCPKRLGLRLALQFLVATTALAMALWFVSCAVRNLGRPYKSLLWILAGLTTVLGFLMIKCDPALEVVNVWQVLMVVTAAAFLLGLYWSVRARRERP